MLRIVVISGLLAVAALGGCSHVVGENDLYYPSRAEAGLWEAAPNVPGAAVEPLAIRVDDVILRGWQYAPEQPTASLLYFYGNAENVAKIGQRLGRLARRLNARVLAMDYRGYGFSGGTPSYAALVSDALVLYDNWSQPQRKQGLPVLVYGRSMGTDIALHLAARRDVDGVILEAPAATSIDIIPGIRRQLPTWARWMYRVKPSAALEHRSPQPVDLARRLHAPLLVIHGEADELIPLASGRRIYQVAASESKRLVPVEAATHNTVDPLDESVLPVIQLTLADSRTYAHHRDGKSEPIVVAETSVPDPEPQPEPVSVAPIEPIAEIPEPQPIVEPQPEPVSAEPIAADPEPQPEPAPVAPAEPIAEIPEPQPVVEPQPEPVSAEPIAVDPEPQPEPVSVAPIEPIAEIPEPQPVVEPQPEPVSAEPIAADPEPQPEPASVVPVEPVAADSEALEAERLAVSGTVTSSETSAVEPTTQPAEIPATQPADVPATQPAEDTTPPVEADRSRGVWIRGPGWQRLMNERRRLEQGGSSD